MGFRDWLTQRINEFLSVPVGTYQLNSHNDFERLRQHIRKGDVLLVEGDQRVSAVIKYLTQSSWSHAAFYVGDELVRRGGELGGRVREELGDQADHALVEALVDGVVAAPLSKYEKYNVRLCRPHNLRAIDRDAILDEAIHSIGLRYDHRNILDLAVYLLRVSLAPRHHQQQRLGSSVPSEVICTSLLGRMFHNVKFPVLPKLTFPEKSTVLSRSGWWRWRREHSLYRAIFHRRHPTLLTPRDFDLSPYFDIVKFNVIEDGVFEYRRIEWAEDALESALQDPDTSRDPE